MHEAYKVHNPQNPLKVQVQIESIAAFENKVIIGSRQGALMMYLIQPNLDGQKLDLQLSQYIKNFSKKSIMQLEVVPGLNILFSLSDNIVSINDIQRNGFPLIHVAASTKGATVFAIECQTSKSLTGELQVLVRLCVAMKRKLQLWYWKYDKLVEYDYGIELKEVPKALAFSGDTICVGYKTEYVLYDIRTSSPEKRDLFPISSSRNMDPCISILSENVFGVAKDEFLISVYAELNQQELPTEGQYNPQKPDQMDKSLDKIFGTLQWTEPLQQLVWDEPYLVGIVNENIEIRAFQGSGSSSVDTLVQKIPDLNRVRFIARGTNGIVYAASLSQLWCIEMIDITIQRDQLLKEKKFQLALKLTNISKESEQDKKDKINEVQTLYAYNLFHQKEFRSSMREFFKLDTDPYEVIGLFPELLKENAKSNLEDKELEEGYLALIDYLTECRQKMKKEFVTGVKTQDVRPILSIIDTTLLKCYLQTNDSLVASVLRLNNCNLEESEKVLKKYRKFEELIILYQTKKQHRSALLLLQSQAQDEGSSLYGYDRTIQYLQHLDKSNIDLIFEFSDWILEKHPEEGIKIFTEDGLPEVEDLPRYTVLDRLLQGHKELVIPYLEQIINGPWKESNPQFSNILIKKYKEKVLALKAEGKQNTHDGYKRKLIDFLKKSDSYHPETVLKEFPTTDLFEERAILLTKLKKYNQTLTIYLQILGNTERAVEYCNEIYNVNDLGTHSVYTNLIKLLVNPPKQSPYNDVPLHPRCTQPDIETVIDIIEKHADKIDPEEILKLLPNDIPLFRLRKFLESSMHFCLENKRRIQALKGLYYAGHLNLQENRIKLEAKSFKLTELSTCVQCKKKFSNQSAFVRLSDGSIAHYSCQKN